MPPTIAHYNGALIWHPEMAPRPLPQSWSSPSPLTPCNGTQQWHHVQSPKVGRHPPLSHPAMAPRPQSWSSPFPLTPCNGTTPTRHPTIAPSNGTTSSAPCNGTLVPRPIRQSGSSPSPPIGSKNPYSYRYLGKNLENYTSIDPR